MRRSRRMNAWVEKLPPLRERVGHAIADREVPPRHRAAEGSQSLGRMDPAQDEGHVWADCSVEERQVLRRLAEGAPLGVDLASAAEDRHRPQIGLAVDPLCPEAAVRFEEAPADIGDGRQSSLHQLVVEGERTALLDQLLEPRVVAPDREVGRQDQVELHLPQLRNQMPAVGPHAFQDPVLDVELKDQPGLGREPIDLAKGMAVLGSHRSAAQTEDAAGVEGDPGQVDLVGVGLDQDWKVMRQARDRVMVDRLWPNQVEAAQVIDHGSPHVHPHQRALRAARAATEKAEVGPAATTRYSWAAVAFEAARCGHQAAASKPSSVARSSPTSTSTCRSSSDETRDLMVVEQPGDLATEIAEMLELVVEGERDLVRCLDEGCLGNDRMLHGQLGSRRRRSTTLCS